MAPTTHSILLPYGMELNSTGPVLTDSGRYRLFSKEELVAENRVCELFEEQLSKFPPRR